MRSVVPYWFRVAVTSVFVSLGTSRGLSGVPRDHNAEATLKGVHDALRGENRLLASKALRTLFERVGPSELQKLKLGPFDTIAAQAAWEEVLATLPRVKQAYGAVDRNKLHRFLGFLEGRMRLDIPAWWQEAFLRAQGDWRENVYFSLADKTFYHWAGVGFCAPMDTKLTKNDRVITVQVAGKSVSVPEATLEKPDSFCNDISVLIKDERVYFAIHRDSPFGYSLTCADPQSRRKIWKAEVLATWWVGGASGKSLHRVAVTEQNGSIVVFGAVNYGGAYIEAFAPSNGKTLFRFSSYH